MKRILAAACLAGFLALPPAAFAAPGGVPEGSGGCIRALVILVDFPDLKNRVGREYAEKRFFGDLDDYIREMSYGKRCLAGDVTRRWVTMPRPVREYRISSRNLEVDKSRVRSLIEDAVNAVEGHVDFSRYDVVALFLRARLDEYGMIGLCGYPGMLGWSSDDVIRTKGGQTVRGGVAIFTFQAHTGTLFHDVAHVLGGTRDGRRVVPCLYDHDLQAKPGPMRKTFIEAIVNMGFWDPMSCHYYEWDSPPPGISSWTKLRLGWLDPSRVRIVRPGERAELLLGPLEDGSADTLAVKVPLSDRTFYLFENRQPIGYDRYLPGRGVLVMYADDGVAECRHGRSPVKLVPADPAAESLKGAAFLPEGKNVFSDPERGLSVRVEQGAGHSLRLVFGP
jgi:M6 family metalloprotease-like protein